MRSRLKLILTSGVIAALTVAGVSLATGDGGGGGKPSASSESPAAFVADRDKGNGIRGRKLRGDFGDADVRAVLEDIHDVVTKQAPDIAGPVIDKAEADNKITAAQADKLRQAAQDVADGKKPDIRALGRGSDVHDVIQDAFEAAHDKAPGIAKPIIDKAVADKKITEAQADRIREMVQSKPGRGHHGPGEHRFGPAPPFDDEDVRAVLEDVHAAVAKQADDIAGPVIDKAEQDGKITAAQADKLRDAAGSLTGDKPRGGPPKNLLELRDADVREVLHDVFEAVAAKTPGIAKPIIDKAVADKKITEAQADKLRNMERRFKIAPGPGRHGKGKGHFGPGRVGPAPEAPDRPAAPAAPAAPQSSTS